MSSTEGATSDTYRLVLDPRALDKDVHSYEIDRLEKQSLVRTIRVITT